MVSAAPAAAACSNNALDMAFEKMGESIEEGYRLFVEAMATPSDEVGEFAVTIVPATLEHMEAGGGGGLREGAAACAAAFARVIAARPKVASAAFRNGWEPQRVNRAALAVVDARSRGSAHALEALLTSFPGTELVGEWVGALEGLLRESFAKVAALEGAAVAISAGNARALPLVRGCCAHASHERSGVRKAAVRALRAAKGRSRTFATFVAGLCGALCDDWRRLISKGSADDAFRGIAAILDLCKPGPLFEPGNNEAGGAIIDVVGDARKAASREPAFHECWRAVLDCFATCEDWPKWARIHGTTLAHGYKRDLDLSAAAAGAVELATRAPETTPAAFERIWAELAPGLPRAIAARVSDGRADAVRALLGALPIDRVEIEGPSALALLAIFEASNDPGPAWRRVLDRASDVGILVSAVRAPALRDAILDHCDGASLFNIATAALRRGNEIPWLTAEAIGPKLGPGASPAFEEAAAAVSGAAAAAAKATGEENRAAPSLDSFVARTWAAAPKEDAIFAAWPLVAAVATLDPRWLRVRVTAECSASDAASRALEARARRGDFRGLGAVSDALVREAKAAAGSREPAPKAVVDEVLSKFVRVLVVLMSAAPRDSPRDARRKALDLVVVVAGGDRENKLEDPDVATLVERCCDGADLEAVAAAARAIAPNAARAAAAFGGARRRRQSRQSRRRESELVVLGALASAAKGATSASENAVRATAPLLTAALQSDEPTARDLAYAAASSLGECCRATPYAMDRELLVAMSKHARTTTTVITPRAAPALVTEEERKTGGEDPLLSAAKAATAALPDDEDALSQRAAKRRRANLQTYTRLDSSQPPDDLPQAWRATTTSTTTR